jgi:DHA1 family bicyclomycin/chloramphenicol resistance-like MFS transporter
MRIRPDSVAFIFLLAVLSALPALATDMSLPALTQIGASLQVSPSRAALTLSVFLVGFAIAPIAYGPLADRYGRRPVLLFGSTLFTLASAACAMAPTLEALLAFRAIQGVGAGAGMVMSLTIVRDLFEGQFARARLSYVATVRIVAPMIAPTLGGWVLVMFDWRAIYLFMTIAGAVVTLAVYLGLPESRPASTMLKSLSIPALAKTYKRVISHPVAFGNAAVNALTFGCQFAYITGSPLLMMETLGMSAQGFGLVFAGTAFGIMLASILNGRLNTRGVSPHRLLKVGLGLSSGTSLVLAVMAFTNTLPLGVLIPVLMANTFSFGLIAPNASHAAVEPVPEAGGVASGVVGALMMSVGAVSGSLVTFFYDGHTARAMMGVMLGCALLALGIYTFWVRPHDKRWRAEKAATAAEPVGR